MKYWILLLPFAPYHLAHAQTPIAEIEGRLSVYLPNDTTSILIGKNVSFPESLSRRNTVVGADILASDIPFYVPSGNSIFGYQAGRTIGGNQNAFYGIHAGENSEGADDNSFFGAEAGRNNVDGDENSYFGYQAGYQGNGYGNSFFGTFCGYQNEGNDNCFFGYEAGEDGKTGNRNAFFGIRSGNSSNGDHNNYFGYEAGYQNDSGVQNLGFGSKSLYWAKYFHRNTAIGDSSMYLVGRNITIDPLFILSSRNVSVGASSLYARSQASTHRSVAIGYGAGYDGGSKSVFIGYEAGKNATQLDNTLYINNESGDNPLIYGDFVDERLGINTSSPEMTLTIGGNGNESRLLLANAGDIFFKNSAGDNKAVLSLHSDDDTYLDAFDDLKFRSGHNLSQDNPDMVLQADGDVGIGFSDPQVKLDVLGTVRGTSVFCGGINACSDIRFKSNFITIAEPLEILSQLNGYYHHWRADEFPEWQFSERRNIGFKAQEIQEILPEVVDVMPEGYLTVDYAKVVPLLVEAIKEQQEIIKKQQAQIDKILKLDVADSSN